MARIKGTLHGNQYTVRSESCCALCWKWCSGASIQAWTRLILFANTFCRFAFEKSLCTYKRCWKWCPRASIQAWTRLILFANISCRFSFGKSLCTYKRCWKWWPRALIQAWTKFTSRSLSAQRLSESTVYVLSYLAHLFLEWEMFQTNVVEKIKTHIFCSVTFF
jgi:hypothetical protein